MGDPENGHDYGEAIEEGESPHPGDLIAAVPGSVGTEFPVGPVVGNFVPEPMVGEDDSTPLADGEAPGEPIPPCPLWAMKEHAHIHWHLLPSHERHQRLRQALGHGDDVLYVIDDGPHHVLVGRRVGDSPDGCVYGLLGRQPLERYEALRDGAAAPATAFDGAAGLALCGVVEEEDVKSSVVFDVDRYEVVDEIPLEFLPGSPFIHFPRDLDIAVD